MKFSRPAIARVPVTTQVKSLILTPLIVLAWYEERSLGGENSPLA